MLTRRVESVYLLFTLLYFAQGAVASYQLNFFKPHLHSEGVPTHQIALLASLVLLPFVLKLVFGLCSDRINFLGLGHRVPYMVLGVFVCAIAFLAAYFVDPGNSFQAFAALILLAAFSMALFDTAADAYAVERVPRQQYVKVQSLMTTGRAVGFTALSVVFALLSSKFGYSIILLLLAVCMLIPMCLLVTLPEHRQPSSRKDFDWGAFRALLAPSRVLLGVLLIFAWFLYQGIDGTFTYFLGKELLASESFTARFSIIKGFAMCIGAAGSFLIVRRYGNLTAVVITLVLVTLSGLAASRVEDLVEGLVIALLTGITAGFHWTVWMTVLMNVADLRIAGSTLAIFQIMANIGIAAGEGVATNLTSTTGFSDVFFYFGVFNLVLVIPAIFVLRRINAHRQNHH